MKKRIDLNDIRLLMQVVEYGSYTAAARAVGIPKSTISQRIAHLEALVGTGLLRRTSRSVSLTEAGSRLLPHAKAVEDLARQVEHAVMAQNGELEGTLRVSSSQAIAQFALSRVVADFLAQNPRVVIKLEASNRLVDIISEGFDMTVRGHIGCLKDSTLIQRVVARAHWALAASPSWIAKHGMPASPTEIAESEALCFSGTPDWQIWPMSKGEADARVEISPRLISDDMTSLKASAIGGAGVACLPGYVLACAFEAGTLVELLPDWRLQTSMISVITPPRPQSSRLAAAFSSFLAAEMPAITRFEQPSAQEARTFLLAASEQRASNNAERD